eukprot:4036257-Pleurochrysis_carterae.AAC.1
MEATSARRTATTLEWFADFLASTERMPFASPAEEGGTRVHAAVRISAAEQSGGGHQGRHDLRIRVGREAATVAGGGVRHCPGGPRGPARADAEAHAAARPAPR